MNRLRLLLIGLALITIVSGCGQQRVLENLGMLQTVGYDRSEGGKLTVSFYMPKFGAEFGSTDSEVMTTTVHTSKEAKMAMARQTHWYLVSGQLRDALFGESLARQGILEQLNSLIRDPMISPRVKFSIVEGTASDVLMRKYEQHPGVGTYIDQLLEKEIRAGAISRVSLFEFERDLLDEGIDPVAPVLKTGDQTLRITGLGLFQDDRYIGKIDAYDMPIFSLLDGQTARVDIHLKLDEREEQQTFIMIGSARNNRKIRVSRNAAGQFEVTFQIKMRGPVLEYTGVQPLRTVQQRKQVEAQIGEAIAKTAKAVITKMQAYNTDSLGIGKHVRNSLSWREWKQLDWREEFPEVKVNCEASFTISNYGRFY